MIYKVLRRFSDSDGKEFLPGTYVEIKDDRLLKIRTRIRRRDLLLARDQEGAKKLIKKSEKIEIKKEQPKKEVKNVKQTKKQKNSVS